jgi:hypothetical protein
MNWMMKNKPEIKWKIPRRLEFEWAGRMIEILEEVRGETRNLKPSQMEMVLRKKAARRRGQWKKPPPGTVRPRKLAAQAALSESLTQNVLWQST